MRILALDPSKTSTGWALWAPGDVPAIGHWQLGTEYTSRGSVFAKLHECMTELQLLGPIDAIFYEDVLNITPPRNNEAGASVVTTNKNSVLIAAGLAGHIESWGEAMGCRIIRAVHQATWRRNFFGSMRRGEKPDLKQLATTRARALGFRPMVHDEAEAVGILDYACENLGITPPWREQQVLGFVMEGTNA